MAFDKEAAKEAGYSEEEINSYLSSSDIDWKQEAYKAAENEKIPPEMFAAVVKTESNFNPSAIGPTTKRGNAIGLSQLMPYTAKDLGVDPRNPYENLKGGARYLKMMYDKFGDWGSAFAAYNAGPNGNFNNPETKKYVQKVTKNLSQFPPSQNKQPSGFDVEGALKVGYTQQEIDEFLNSPAKKETIDEKAAKYGEIKSSTPWYVEAIRPTLQAVGLTAGGAVGAGAGTAITPIAGTAGGAVVGSGLGYSAANQLSDIILESMGYKKPKTTGQRFVESAQDIGAGGLMEYGGQVVGKAIGAISKNQAVSDFIKLPAEQRQAIRAAKDLNYYMSPGQETGKKGALLVEKALSYIPGSAGIMQKKNMEQLQRLTDLRNKFIDEVNQGRGTPESVERVGLEIKNVVENIIGGKEALQNKQSLELADNLLARLGSTDTYESLGLKTQEILNKKSVEAVAKKNALYQEIGQSIPEGNLETPNINKVAEQLRDDIEKSLNPDGTAKKVINKIIGNESEVPEVVKIQGVDTRIDDLPPLLRDKVIQELKSETPVKDWNQLQKWRTELSDLIKNEDLAIKNGNPGLKGQLTPEGRIYKQLKNALDKDFEEIAATTGTDALDKLKAANAFYKDEFAPVWKNKDIQRLAYSDPSKIVDVVFRPGNIEEINIAKKALGDKGYDELHKKFVSKVFEDATRNKPFSWDNVLKEFTKYGDETLTNTFKPEEWKTIARYITKGMNNEALPVADKFLLDVIKKSAPEQISNLIFHDNNVRNINLIKQSIPKATWDEARANWLSDKILKMSKHDQYLPITSSTQIFKHKGTLDAVLSKEESSFIDKMFQISKSAETVEKLAGNPSGTAQAVITFEAGRMILSGMGDIALGTITANPGKIVRGAGEVMSITFLPQAMAKIYLSPVGRKLVERGIQLPANSPQAAKIIAQLGAIASTEAINKEEP